MSGPVSLSSQVRLRGAGEPGCDPNIVRSGLELASQPIDPGPPGGNFIDDDGSVFEADIAWMADEGITRG